jgi:hypothetical protein
MRLFGNLFGFRPPPEPDPVVGALELLQSYGLRGYARPGDREHESRVYIYDGMNLAEGGVPGWIENMRLYLESQGVELESVENAPAPHGYTILLNGRKYLIYPYRNYVDWPSSVVSSVQIVNELLLGFLSQERGYLLRGEGVEGVVVFVNQANYDRLLADPTLDPEHSLTDVGTYDHPSRDADKAFPAAEVEQIGYQ